MITFLNEIDLRRVKDKKREWVYLSPFKWEHSDGRKGGADIGDTTDKASIPRIVWVWLSPDDIRIIRGALLHDDLYEKQQINSKWIKRKEADLLLYESCRQDGMRWTMAQAVYMAVRSGGWKYWNKTAKKLENIYYV